MFIGVLSGLFWAIETIMIGQVMSMETMQVLFITPFICTFIHDAFSSLWIGIHNHRKTDYCAFRSCLKTSNAKFVSVAAIIGGPIGMSGYMMTIHYLGSSIGAVVSAIFPAVGAVLAVIFLKEKMKWYQWIFLFFTLLGVYGINYSSDINVVNLWLGMMGAILCSFGWGMEAVILAKCLKEDGLKDEHALQIRQTTSAIVYGIFLIPCIYLMDIPLHFLQGKILLLIATAALFATLSYLFYYKAIYKIGATKAMALNITYVAWSMILVGTGLTPMTIFCSVLVFVCGILSTIDFKKLNV